VTGNSNQQLCRLD